MATRRITLLFCSLLVLMSTMTSMALAASCPTPPTVANFELGRYLGKWYENGRNDFFWEPSTEVCSTANYTLNANKPGFVIVDNRGRDGVNAPVKQYIGEAYVPNPQEPAKLAVKFFSISPWGPYWVLDTDYTSYSMVYSCTEFLGVRSEDLWILSRTQVMSDELLSSLEAKAKALGIDTSKFHRTQQAGCPQSLH